jgi:gliding motility-associated lipoprotein GldD
MQKLMMLACFCCLLMEGCRPPVYSPKPVGYFKLDTPQTHEYQRFEDPTFPYVFEYPVYSHTAVDSAFFSEKADNPYWLNIEVPTLNATINLTYKAIKSPTELTKVMDESYGLSYFHRTRADYISDQYGKNKYGLTMVLYTVGGNAASTYQFTVTDSQRHFMRGALYFPVSPNADSLKPATDFLRRDIVHLLETIRFK